jgi:hypothetical protein
MPVLKIGAAMLAATLILAPAAAFADQGGIPNSNAKTNTHAHPYKADPQPTKGNDERVLMREAKPAEATSSVRLAE